MSNDSDTKTTIGRTIVIRGKLKSDEDLVVEGRIDAELESSKALFIENSGIVKANVRVRSLRVNGILVGNIHATEKAEIASDGRVVGDINAPTLVIADGAAFRGQVDMPTFDEQPRAEEPEEKPKTAAPAETETRASSRGTGKHKADGKTRPEEVVRTRDSSRKP